ncbi:MAG: DAK2 domain-containing protein, partial [Erysipelotrichaceae bacterium]|nr:DAK2 domain-containing protein [Erysipelotrichaceae bacterium]
TFKEMLLSGANNLQNKKEDINALNVFPVPDGDTGTNMSMTFGSGVTEVGKTMNDHVGDTAKVLAKNMLMGARGNSGVILSQIFKGIQKTFAGKETVNVADIATAFVNGAQVAYKAVMRPVEGTILTVARESSLTAYKAVAENPAISIEEYFDILQKQAQISLDHTPDLLAVLKEVGVVDSGGSGLVSIIEGFNSYLHGSPISLADESESKAVEIGYGVDIHLELSSRYQDEFDPEILSKSLAKSSNVLEITRDAIYARVRVNSLNPGEIISTVQRFGEMLDVKVVNLSMVDQPKEVPVIEAKKEPEVEYEIVTVCNGEGIKEEFQSLGADHVINGGQTMNPATEDFVAVIEKTNAAHVFILPNNSNIILAAQQACEVLSDRDIVVIPTTTIPEGLSACIAFNGEADAETNITMMTDAVKGVKTGEVTTAIKNTRYNNVSIHKGDYMGIAGKDILVSTRRMMETTKKLVDKLIDNNTSFVTIIHGLGVKESDVKALTDYITRKYNVDCGLIDGKQDLYPFIIGAE